MRQINPASAKFHDLLKEIGELHDKKQADYGLPDDPFANVRASEGWGVAPWIGALVRATDKIHRLQAFAKKGVLQNEGVADSLKDIAVYALIALVLFEEQAVPQEGTVKPQGVTVNWVQLWLTEERQPLVPETHDPYLEEP